jgi:hypothetical protein
MAVSIKVQPFTDLTAFTGTTGTIPSSVKAGLITGVTNLETLISGTSPESDPGHPDFVRMPEEVAAQVRVELQALIAAITAHA